MSRKLVAEGFGTFLFFFVGAGAIVTGDWQVAHGGQSAGLLGVALAHGLALAILASAFGAISGAHFNPAVTFAIWLTGRIQAAEAGAYVGAQAVGAVVAGLALRAVFPESVWTLSHLGTPGLGAGVTPAAGIVVEAILTMVLLCAVLGTAVHPAAPKIGGLAIGLAIAADILMGGPLTGAAMNPARWFGTAIASGTLDNWYVWLAGPLAGAGITAFVWRTLFLPAPEAAPATITAQAPIARPVAL